MAFPTFVLTGPEEWLLAALADIEVDRNLRRDLPPEVELINLREHPAAREILNSFKARDLYLSGSLTCLVRRSSNCAPPGGDQWEVLS